MLRKSTYALALAVSLLSAKAAMAHPKLATANPAANSAVTPPTKIQLVFSESLVAQMSGLDVTMTEMPGMKMGPMKITGFKTSVAADGKTLVAAFPKALAAGTYKVDYHVVSADTHRIQGSYNFKVK